LRQIYTRAEYFADLVERIGRLGAGDRVMLATMDFGPGQPEVKAVLEALGAAAGRGARVRLYVDAYAFLVHRAVVLGPEFFGRPLDGAGGSFRAAYVALEALKAAGGEYVITNRPGRPFTLPIAGRSHIKFAILNDRLYVGGCNLNNSHQTDLMVGWDDAASAEFVAGVAQRAATGSVRQGLGGQDQSFEVDAAAQLLVDAGRRGQSRIMETALELIDKAQERILITCQFFPDGAICERLLAAHKRGVQVEIIYNHPSKHHFPNNLLHYAVEGVSRLRFPERFFVHVLGGQQNFLHAKLLSTEHATIIGSHNYVGAGVRLGTAELALVCREPEFGRAAEATLRRQLEVVA
jgi:cardiolipin synthase A/B